MTRNGFLSSLRDGLAGLPDQDIDDILSDYHAHFADGEAAGRSEDEVAAALGDPVRLARELKAEARLRRWEKKRSVGNLAGVIFALIGLATVDVFLLIPLLSLLAFFVLIGGVTVSAVTLSGLGALFAFPWTIFVSYHLAAVTGLTALGLLCGGVGGGALLLLVTEWSGGLLARFARLHFRLVDPTSHRA
ncbi:MAG TPA: DUF1700 domain-containing protein [Telmatospirillum sp.]|nr:DUF1700 domain-containing protein [Telmatospirillum sp.]